MKHDSTNRELNLIALVSLVALLLAACTCAGCGFAEWYQDDAKPVLEDPGVQEAGQDLLDDVGPALQNPSNPMTWAELVGSGAALVLAIGGAIKGKQVMDKRKAAKNAPDASGS